MAIGVNRMEAELKDLKDMCASSVEKWKVCLGENAVVQLEKFEREANIMVEVCFLLRWQMVCRFLKLPLMSQSWVAWIYGFQAKVWGNHLHHFLPYIPAFYFYCLQCSLTNPDVIFAGLGAAQSLLQKE